MMDRAPLIPVEQTPAPAHKIMIVDDDPGIRDTLSALIEDQDYQTVTAEDGAQAMGLLNQGPYLCIFTDLMMPGMTGIELIKVIKKTDTSIPVIVITGHASIETAIEAMKQGASDFITKPFKTRDIEFIINKVKREKTLLEQNKRFSDELHLHRMIDDLAGQVEKKSQEIISLQTISDRITGLKGIRDIVAAIVDVGRELFDGSLVSFFPINRQKMTLITPDEGELEMHRELILGTVAQEIISGAQGSDEYKTFFPLLIEGQIFGALSVITEHAMNREDQRKVMYLLERTAERMENVALYESLYESVLSTLYSMAKLLDARDPYTSQHSTRVTSFAMEIGRAMRLSDEDCDILSISSSLHDIGKVGIPDSILRKPDRLTNEEFDTIRTHPDIGADILKAIPVLSREIEIIRHHHEFYNGKGYPAGLSGEKIPLLSRIITLADAYDAMTSDRPYRKGINTQAAIEEIERCKGSHFDPAIANIFINIVSEES